MLPTILEDNNISDALLPQVTSTTFYCEILGFRPGCVKFGWKRKEVFSLWPDDMVQSNITKPAKIFQPGSGNLDELDWFISACSKVSMFTKGIASELSPFTECPKIYRISVLHLLRYTANLYFSKISTDLGKFWDIQPIIIGHLRCIEWYTFKCISFWVYKLLQVFK